MWQASSRRTLLMVGRRGGVMQTHDLVRQVRQLEQALSSDKIAVAVLLGAGCGSSIRVIDGGAEQPLVPDIAGLTREVGTRLSARDDLREPYAGVLRQLGEDGNGAPNVEDILSHVRTLRPARCLSECPYMAEILSIWTTRSAVSPRLVSIRLCLFA